MTIPIPNNPAQEDFIPGTGFDSNPQSVITKNSMWILHSYFGRMYIQQYLGIVTRFDITHVRFIVTKAKNNNGTINNNYFWYWALLPDKSIVVSELEPFPDVAPTIIRTKTILSGYVDCDFFVEENAGVKAIALTDVSTLYTFYIDNPFYITPTIVSQQLNWSPQSLGPVSTFAVGNGSTLLSNYLKTSSPPNVVYDEWAFDPPVLTAARINHTQVELDWNTITGVDQYVLERSLNDITFAPINTTTIYTGPNVQFFDTIPTYGTTLYYRIMANDTANNLSSDWSSIVSVFIDLPIVADFSGTPLSGPVALTVNFTDLSINSPTTWFWDFGDGGTSILQNPTYVYNTQGVYTVTLTASKTFSSDIKTRVSYVGVSAVTHSVFYNGNGNTGGSVPVDSNMYFLGSPATVLGNTGGLVKVGSLFDLWNTAPDRSGTDYHPSDVFSMPGTDVTLYAQWAGAIVADFVALPTVGFRPLSVSFSDTSTGNPDSWSWNFGDGNTSTLKNPVHVFINPGTYSVSLTVTNIVGSTSILKATYIQVTPKLCDISLGVFFNSPIKIRYNNFYGTTIPYSNIAPVVNGDGNFQLDPLYTDPNNINPDARDYSLQTGSPDINTGDPIRWDTITSEILSGSRRSVAPMDRDIDRVGVDRGAEDARFPGAATGDIGAYEYTTGSHTGDYYVSERGFDFSNYGTLAQPFWSPDRGFSFPGADAPVHMETNPITGFPDGSRYGRFFSKDWELENRPMVVGAQTPNDVAYVYPTYPAYDTGAVYVDPDGSDASGTGSSLNPFRTINKALQSTSSSVIVRPGLYPLFQGMDAKRIIGIPQTRVVALPWTTYQDSKETDWNKYGTPNIVFGSICLSGTSGIYSRGDYTDPSNTLHTSLGSTFGFMGNVTVKTSVVVGTGSTYIEAYNSSITEDSAVIMLQNSGGTLTVSFMFNIGGLSYTYNSTVAGFNFSKRIRVGINVKNGNISMTAESSGVFSKAKSLAYVNTYTWYAALASTGSGVKKFYNYSINADSFNSPIVEVQDTVNTRRKIFGIIGTTSL